MRQPLASKRTTLTAQLERLGGTLGYGPRVSQEQRQVFLSLVSGMRTDATVRARTMDRLLDAKRVDAETMALRRFMLEEIPAELLDITHAHDVIRMRLQPTMPEEAAQLAASIREVDRASAHVEAALDSLAAVADRDVLEAEGAIGRRVTAWTPEERAAYAEKFGLDALAAAVSREIVFGAPVRAGHPDTLSAPEARGATNADLSDFFKTFVDPAEAAADAALRPAA